VPEIFEKGARITLKKMDIASVMEYLRTERTRTWKEVLGEYPTYKEKLEKLYYYLMHCERTLNLTEEKAKELYEELFDHPLMNLAYSLRDEDAYFKYIKMQRRRLIKILK